MHLAFSMLDFNKSVEEMLYPELKVTKNLHVNILSVKKNTQYNGH